MSGVLLERGVYFYGACRLFSTLKDCVLQRKLLHKVDLRPSPACCATRSHANGVTQRAEEASSNNEISSHPKHWESFQPFPSMMEMRRREARRSIIVEVQSQSCCADLLHYCNNIGPTRNAFYYSVNKKNYVLLEFKDEESKEETLKLAGHATLSKIVPVTSSYLWFKQSKEECKNSPENNPIQNVSQHLVYDETEIVKGLNNIKRVEDQMEFLFNIHKISDFSTRLRFLTSDQLERALNGIFPHARAFPFGSSVSGFGRNSGDLDIYLQFFWPDRNQASNQQRLMFHAKIWREDTNLQLKLIGDLLSVMLPGCTNVCSIMGARVPIIKYEHTFTNMECDVQNSSGSGVDMTHLLWIMCNWDKRVAPLVYTLRYWAKVNNVIQNLKPSPSITNFNLIILIIFFLQVENILPTVRFLEKSASPRTSVQYDDKLKVNFLQDINELPEGLWTVQSEPTVDLLLLKFFEFYSKFSFDSKSVSIIDGKSNFKPDSRPMWIVNPLYPTMNTTRNVSKEGVNMFQRMVRESFPLLQDALNLQGRKGLLALIPNHRKLINDNSLNKALSAKMVQPARVIIPKGRPKKQFDSTTSKIDLSKRMKNLGKDNQTS